MNILFYWCIWCSVYYVFCDNPNGKNINNVMQNIRNTTQLINNKLNAVKKNLTALNRIKEQVHKIVDNTKNKTQNVQSSTKNVTKIINDTKLNMTKINQNPIANKVKNVTKVSNDSKVDFRITSRNKTTSQRIKRRVGARDNLDNLYPTLSIRLVNINLDWFNFAKSTNVSQLGTSFMLFDGKTIISHVMNVGNFGNYYTISSLEQDRIYRGEIKLLTEKNEVKNFIRKQSDGKNIEEFELTTPFIVTDDEVKNILEIRELLEKKFKEVPQNIKVNYIDIKLMFPKLEKLGYTVEVSRYYTEGNNSVLSAPEQTIELLPPVKYVVLSDQLPHELLRVSLKNVKENEADGEIYFSTIHTINIFTGSVYKMGVTNFSRSLDLILKPFQREKYGNISSLLSNSKDNYQRTVKCYSDDDVYDGYPCANSDVCIPLDWICDGEMDCKGRDDELHCDGHNNYDNDYYYRGNCRKYEFRCRSKGQSVCLPNSWLCDGRRDCQDGWDEDDDNCYESFKQLRPGYTNRKNFYSSKSCGRNYFRCWDGKDCVALRDVCNGEDDCLDGSDENICENWSRYCDSTSEFRCYKTAKPTTSLFSRSCIPKSWVCDDQEDCPDGEDESSKICNNYNKFSISNIFKPFGIGFEISAGFKKK